MHISLPIDPPAPVIKTTFDITNNKHVTTTFTKTAAVAIAKLTAEDADFIRQQLSKNNLVTFIANGSILPRKSGIDPRPLETDAIPFKSPESLEIAYEEPQAVMVAEPEPIYISGEDMTNGLWGPSSELAEQIGRDRYEVMYAIYEANKDNFIDNNINQPKPDRNFIVDLSLVENLDTGFVIDEVKRHIFCSC